MTAVVLGATGIVVEKNGFGCLPIQRVTQDEAVHLLQKAYAGGINFFDTARFYSDSEEKLGVAFAGMRDKITLASKTMAKNTSEFWEDLNTTLRNLQTDYLDIFQFHNPPFCPKPGDGSDLFEAMTEAKRMGKVRHIGITNHRLDVANEAVDSGLYETLQFPFSYLAVKEDVALVKKCKEKNVGFIAMKSLSGGLLTNAEACYAFAAEFDNVLPIWGIQRENELNQFLSFINNPPTMTEELSAFIEDDRMKLQGEFCRGCGYCMPCPVGIEINNCARMIQMIRRSTTKDYLTPKTISKMLMIEECVNCRQCASQCPYSLDTPSLLRKNLEDYKRILSGEIVI